jgi:hypothetical protein
MADGPDEVERQVGGLLDALGRNTLRLVADSVSIHYAAEEDDTGVAKTTLELHLEVATDPDGDELATFTQTYSKGRVILSSLSGEYRRNDQGQSVVGALVQHEKFLDIRLFALVQEMTALACAFTVRSAATRPIINVRPYGHLWEWDGKGIVYVRRFDVTFGSVSLAPR